MKIFVYIIVGLVIAVFIAIFVLSVYAFVGEWRIRMVVDTDVVTFSKIKHKKRPSIFIECECKNEEDKSICFETTDKKIKSYKEGDELRVYKYKKKYYWAADQRLIRMLITIASGILSMVCIVESVGLLVSLIVHNA